MSAYPDCVCCGAAGCGSCPGDQCRDCDLYCSSMSYCDRERSAPPAPPTATEPCPRCGGGAWLGVGPMCGACIDAATEQPAKPSPAWVWKTLNDEFVAGTLDTESVTARATVLRSRAHVTIRAVAGNIVEMHTTLPAWSQAQQRRWVEQWVASQADAAAAAFEAAEGMR